uniref:Vacuolar ATPase assembly integral membrane protein VMA21 homolog n=1 Tax=Ditylenchus dipsaci TaxID=166011 RepID=A0A915D2A0_9BILA
MDTMELIRDKNVHSAVKNLMTYSLMILVLPLASMFLLKQFLFEGLLGYQTKDSMTYAGIAAIILVHVVLIFWIKTAWQEDAVEKNEKKD